MVEYLTGHDVDRVADRDELREAQAAGGAELDDVAREAAALRDHGDRTGFTRHAELERLAPGRCVRPDAVRADEPDAGRPRRVEQRHLERRAVGTRLTEATGDDLRDPRAAAVRPNQVDARGRGHGDEQVV